MLVIISVVLAVFTYNRATGSKLEDTLAFVIVPLQNAGSSISRGIGNITSRFKGTDALSEENRILKDELLSARAEVSRLRMLEEDTRKLEALLQMSDNYPDYEVQGAYIISKDPGNWYKSFTVNKGSSSGIKKDMPVITDQGLVGKVSRVGVNYALVTSIIDDSEAVTSKSLRTGDICYVNGTFSKDDTCIMQYYDDKADFVVGDEIVTSQLSKIYPAGIRIGYITEFGGEGNGTVNSGLISPAVNFKNLSYVLILKNNFEQKPIEETTETESK